MKVDFKIPMGYDVAKKILSMDNESGGAIFRSILLHRMGEEVSLSWGSEESDVIREILRTIENCEKKSEAGRKGGNARKKDFVVIEKVIRGPRSEEEKEVLNEGALEDDFLDGLEAFF